MHRSHSDIGGEEPLHALLPKATAEGTDRIRVNLGLLCSLGDGAIGEQHEGTNDFIAPLRLIDKGQLQLRKRCGRFHSRPFHLCAGKGVYVAYPTEAVTPY
jgi:hypothetical protein